MALIDDGIKIESFHECFYSTVPVKWRLATKLEATFPKCTHCAAWIKEGPQPAPNSAMDAIALIKNIESYVNLCFSVVDSCKVRINMTKKSWSKLLKIARQHQ